MPNIRISEAGPDIERFTRYATQGDERIYSDEIYSDMCQVPPSPMGLINFDVSTFCNLRCKMCTVWNEFHDSTLQKHLIDFNLFTLAIDKIQQFAPNTRVGLTSRGELTCHPRIMDIFKTLSDRHQLIVFITNGLLLKPEMSQALLKMGVRSVTISHDALTPETYEAVRGSKKYYSLVENTWELLRQAGGRQRLGNAPFIALNYVKLPENAHEILPFIQFWGPYVTSVNILKLRNQETYRVENQTEPFASMKRYPCRYPWTDMSISSDGDIYPCCIGFEDTMKMGNVANHDLSEVWRSDKYNELRKEHIIGSFKSFPICEKCDHWKTDRQISQLTCLHEDHLFKMHETSVGHQFEYIGKTALSKFSESEFNDQATQLFDIFNAQ
jgi:radical SAM protein with 4Fe4S-binding SPASM domain